MTTTPKPGATAPTTSRESTWLSPKNLLLLAGPVLLFGGYALHPDLPNETLPALREIADVRGTYLAAKIAVAFGSLLMVALLLAVRHAATPQRGRALATVAAVLGCVGFACNALSQSLWGYLLFFASDPSVGAAAGAAVVDAGQHADVIATLPVSFFSVPLLALGLLFLAAALWRAGSVPRWVPVAIVLVDVAAPAFPVGPMNLVTGALATAAFAVALNARHGASDVGK